MTYNEDWTLVGIPHLICLACERKPISKVWIAGGKIFQTAALRRPFKPESTRDCAFAVKLVKPSLKLHSCVRESDYGKDLAHQSKQHLQRVRGAGGKRKGLSQGALV